MRKIIWGLVLAFSCFLPGVCSAAPQMITASGIYVMGENDSPKIAKDAARQEAMRAATEKAGVYVESYSRTQNMELSADEVKIISGAVLKVLQEKAEPELKDGVWKYTVVVTCEVDTDNIDLKSLLENRNKLEKLQQERDALKKQNEELLEKYKQAKGQEKEKIGTELYCGEYGVIDRAKPEDTVLWFRKIHDCFERHGIARCAWSYKEMDFGLSDHRLDGVRSELLPLL